MAAVAREGEAASQGEMRREQQCSRTPRGAALPSHLRLRSMVAAMAAAAAVAAAAAAVAAAVAAAMVLWRTRARA